VIPTLYSLGKAKIVGMASGSEVVGVNKSRSAEKTEAVTGFFSVSRILFYLYLILNPTIIKLKINVKELATIIGKA